MRGCETTLSLEAHAAMSDSNGDSIYDTVILPPLAPDLEFIQAPNLKGNFIHIHKLPIVLFDSSYLTEPNKR